ncbi:hypothetical protein ILUMI_23675 [Ignelater luminosus]|uniref:Uncharacterized protein n=1 Tax=Ignelater luminosus TaxID=2038154 RepID=A0A8K0C7M5_IGNLU|nr:hypothetical protein ILUMI_23675 [Ignelater luminosus]
MNTGVISLLLLPLLTVQGVLSMVGAQVGLENVGGLNFGPGLPQLDLVQAQQAQAVAQVGVPGFPNIPSYYPPIYPQPYPVIDDYSYYGPSSILSTIIRAIRNCISRILTIPWRIVRFIKEVSPCMVGPLGAGAQAQAQAQVMKRNTK